MPLLDLKTNLKDLKFGRDERGGGNSGQPYVVTKIPATNEPLQTGFSGGVTGILAGIGAGAAIGAIGGSILGSTGTGAAIGAVAGLGIGLAGTSLTGNGLRIPTSGTGGPDYLLRGGTLLPNAIIDDETRLGKFFASTEGLLFTTKQNLLSRISVKTQASPNLLNDGIYTSLSTLTQAAVLPFGGHVNKQGLNPFAETGPDSTNERLYGIKVTPLQPQFNNRLVKLYGQKIVYNINQRGSAPNIVMGDGISDDPLILLSYEGGPNSILGIGKTRIRYSNPTFNLTLSQQINNPNFNYLTWDASGLSSNYTKETTNYTEEFKPDPSFIGPGSPILGFEVTENVIDLNNHRNVKGYIPAGYVRDFRKKLLEVIEEQKLTSNTLISKSPNYQTKAIEQRVNLGDPGNATNKNLTSYTNGDGGIKGGYQSLNGVRITNANSFGAASENSFDKLNISLPIIKDKNTIYKEYEDLIPFRIGVLDTSNPGGNKTYIYFRAFLNQITDNYTSDVDPTKYIGRGENFYTYKGFDRRVSLSWTVVAQSKVELIPMYTRLNYLASLCAPDYSDFGYMRGNIITLTIGGYFYEQPGIITGLNYEMNDDSATWEIGIDDDGNEDNSVKQLPHLIKVNSFNFIPIHEFTPKKQSLNIKENGEYFGKQRYIALQNDSNNSWENIKTSTNGVNLPEIIIRP